MLEHMYLAEKVPVTALAAFRHWQAVLFGSVAHRTFSFPATKALHFTAAASGNKH